MDNPPTKAPPAHLENPPAGYTAAGLAAAAPQEKAPPSKPASSVAGAPSEKALPAKPAPAQLGQP
eukprot:12432470-Alexandrium_andersonii.AAC.1